MRIIVCNPIHESGNSNGILALTQLASTLKTIGHEVIILPLQSLNADAPVNLENILAISKSRMDFRNMLLKITAYAEKYNLPLLNRIPETLPSDVIVIYPETTTKNFLQADKIIRYLGAKDGAFKNGKAYTPNGEKLFVVSHSKILGDNIDQVLFFPEIDESFYNRDKLDFYGRVLKTCYVGKGHLFKNDIRIESKYGVEITRHWPPKKSQVADLLSNCKFFFTFDHWSSMTVEAIICGAIPVFVGNDPWPEFDVDAAELGPIPRLSIDQVDKIPDRFMDYFMIRRLEIIKELSHLQANWRSNVVAFAQKTERFFFDRSR